MLTPISEKSGTSSSESDDAVLREGYRLILCDFIETLHLDQLQLSLPAPITTEILGMTSGLDLTPEEEHRVSVIASFSSYAVNRCYPNFPNEIRVLIGVYTMFMVTIEDYCPYMDESILGFGRRMLGGQPQQHALLEGAQKALCAFYKCYGEFLCQVIFKSTLEFFNGTFLEYHCNHLIPSHEAVLFPDYLRYKAGNSEAYACFIFNEWEFPESKYLESYLMVIPEMRIFIDAANDFISFYKESIVGCDRFNYIINYAKVHEISVLDSLKIRANDIVNSIRASKEILKNHLNLLKPVIDFIEGFLYFHLTQGRFRIHELNLPYNFIYSGTCEEDYNGLNDACPKC
jgi:hypothetical protein